MRAPRVRPPRQGIALVAVLYFLVLAAMTSIAVVFGTRAATRHVADARSDAALIGAADVAVYGALDQWNGGERDRQAIGSTMVLQTPAAPGIAATVWVSRLGSRVFSLVADVHPPPNGPSRRVMLLVRVPSPAPRFAPALLSAVDVSVGEGAHVFASDTGACADTASAAITLAPSTLLSVDPAIPVSEQPSVRIDSAAADSAAYLQLGGWSWDDLIARADVRLAPDAVIAPTPIADGTSCRDAPANWGDPVDSASPCAARLPVVVAPGDLTIEGGRGQGVLLVDGRLTIAGPFVYSGQIVVRRGMETRADAISISGAVYAWRATSDSTRTHASRNDIVLAHGASLRGSRCDAAHGMTSFLQPRAVRAHGWTELF